MLRVTSHPFFFFFNFHAVVLAFVMNAVPTRAENSKFKNKSLPESPGLNSSALCSQC